MLSSSGDPPAAGPRRTAQWRIALVLGAGTGIGAMLVIPYAVAATGAPLHTRGLAVALSGVQSTGVGFLVAWAGLRLGQPLGLDVPLLRSWTERRAFGGKTHWTLAVAVGVLASVLIAALDLTLFRLVLSSAEVDRIRNILESHHPARWQGALACFYGGVGEEVQLRLFLMTAIAWCLAKGAHSKSAAVFIAANIIAALVFGVGHLPFAAKVLGALTTGLVARTIVLNGLAGVLFGELYRRYGLEHAIVAHFSADVVLHVVIGG